MIKLSKPSKMPCKSWSLQAIDTCPGSTDKKGELVPACAGCYATTGNYRFPNVKNVRVHNGTDWKRSAWVDDMVKAIGKDTHFRWLDSGDLYSLTLARKVYTVMLKTPNTAHWLPTRMYKFSKFKAILHDMAYLPNVVVRHSSDSITGELLPDTLNQSTIVETLESAPIGSTPCKAYSQGGKCLECRSCWDKAVSVIAYPAHGKKIAKFYKSVGSK